MEQLQALLDAKSCHTPMTPILTFLAGFIKDNLNRTGTKEVLHFPFGTHWPDTPSVDFAQSLTWDFQPDRSFQTSL